VLFFEDVFDWLKANYESIQTDLPGSVPGISQHCALQLNQPAGYSPAIFIIFDNYQVTFLAPIEESDSVAFEKVLEATSYEVFGFKKSHGLDDQAHFCLVHVIQMAYIESGELKMASVESGEIEFAIEQLTSAASNVRFRLQD
jgi:hypothetical protein